MILTKHEETKKGRLFHENEKLRIFVSSCSIHYLYQVIFLSSLNFTSLSCLFTQLPQVPQLLNEGAGPFFPNHPNHPFLYLFDLFRFVGFLPRQGHCFPRLFYRKVALAGNQAGTKAG